MRASRPEVFLAAGMVLASQAGAADLRVMKTGLGFGTITSPAGIACGTGGTACDFAGTATVTLTATVAPAPSPASTFVRWGGDCTGTATTCTVTLSVDRSVKAEFALATPIPEISGFTPEAIQDYLDANTIVDSPARFLKALPAAFKQGWIMMSRSESLQPGVAALPRLLLSSIDAKTMFTIGMGTHSSYPGAHPNAIEFMQWDAARKNFRFHEIVLNAIPEMGDTALLFDGTVKGRFPARNRGVAMDDVKCSACHSTRNVVALDRSVFPFGPATSPGTDGDPPGSVQVKNKPNWDTYDSWGGMLPFNRDRIYPNSVEALAFRRLLNAWSWRNNDSARAIIEQLELQPPNVLRRDTIFRDSGGANDGNIRFAFDVDPADPNDPGITTNYSFDGLLGTGPATDVLRGGSHVRLRHPSDLTDNGEGRGVQLFDLLGGGQSDINPQRVADELIHHRFATGSFPIDVRPLALAISRGDLTMANAATVITSPSVIAFLDARNGMTLDQVFLDTRARADSLTRRKADIQKLNLDRTGDIYLDTVAPQVGLIQEFGSATGGTLMDQVRREVFRRPRDLGYSDSTVMSKSSTVTMTGVQAEAYVDREDPEPNTEKMALFRYFLEPLGVSVDKWSIGVRGRSRTYTFADIFTFPTAYTSTFNQVLDTSLSGLDGFPGLTPPINTANLLAAANNSLASLPAPEAYPTFTDVQRIFNKSCIECHGGLNYPPVSQTYAKFLDFSENEDPAEGDRLTRSHLNALSVTSNDTLTSTLYLRIKQQSEACPDGMMPCGGPPLSGADVMTIKRWILGGRASDAGDPHLQTVDGTHYDFQSAGEFVLLRGPAFELQVRQSPVETGGPLGPNPHTGLSTCVSLNTAVAIRMGSHRITYGPNLSGVPDPSGLQLRVDGTLVPMFGRDGKDGRGWKHPKKPDRSIDMSRIMVLPFGGRILPTSAPNGIQIEFPGGTDIVVTPAFWVERQLWYMNIDVRHARADQGPMGAIAPGNWLPALPNGALLGPRPADLHQRYLTLYETFADAWRVTDATSLFDYAPGTSTGTFTFGAWPFENPESCLIGEDDDEPAITVARLPSPQRSRPPWTGPTPPWLIKRTCADIIDPASRANCEADVAVTGDTSFANTYFLTQQVLDNRKPAAPALVSPANTRTGLGRTVTFTWNKTRDLDGGRVTYRHCLWSPGSLFTLQKCKEVRDEGRDRHHRYDHHKREPALSTSVSRLERGKTYFWKVIAEDGQGGTVESETWHFAVRK